MALRLERICVFMLMEDTSRNGDRRYRYPRMRCSSSSMRACNISQQTFDAPQRLDDRMVFLLQALEATI